jgi:ERCC4-type nuclease
MFQDIFSETSIKKEEKEKPIIIADIHEKDSLIFPELIEQGVNLKITYLEIADYLIGKTAIERKTINDFVLSILSKRLFEQLLQMQRYENRMLILEGNINKCESDINESSLRGFILSVITDFKTSIIYTKDYKETSFYLTALAKKETKKKSEISFHSRIPKTIKEQKRYVLESFPKIGPATSKKLLEKFENLRKIFNADEKELRELLKSRANGFIDILNDDG